MKPNIIDYVIVCETEEGDSYLHRDEFHYYFSHGIHSAKHFKSIEDAKHALTSSEFRQESKLSYGTAYPPPAIHRALQLNNAKRSGKGKLKITPVLLGEAVETIEISGEIKEPKVYIY